MRITFKNVGQGDSIILEWNDEGKNKIGIIDCNKIGKSNPVIDHISASDYTEIEFIILSHPHEDHYSGMVDLLKFANQNQIVVKQFGHSLFILGQDFYKYLNSVEIDTAALQNLQELVKEVDVLVKKGFIRKMTWVNENVRFDLGAENIYLKCLSPSQKEAEQYMNLVKYEPSKYKKRASSAANYLSTVFKLVVVNRYYLFTADSEAFTFTRILKENMHAELVKKKLHVCQLPHHGSSKNFVPEFWEAISKYEERHAVASAGLHLTYKHPHFPVLKSFHNEGFKIHATNIVHGMEDYVDYIEQIAKTTAILNTTSALVDNYSGGEKIFDV